MEKLETWETEVLSVIEILFFLVYSIHTFGRLRNLVLLAEIDGKETIIIDLEQDWILALILNLLTQRQYRARDRKEVHTLDARTS